MPTYLYGLVLARNAASVPSGVTGLQGSSVRALSCGELGAIVSTLERMPGSATLDDVRAHDAVLQSVVDGGATTVAVRFGQCFAGDEEACKHVADQGDRVSSVLRGYDGCVEMRLLLALDIEVAEPVQPSTGPGRAYLEKLHAERESVERLALKDALGPVVQAERVEALPRGRGVVFSHLVRREDVSAYRDVISAMPALAEAIPVGPLALYSFAEPMI